VCNAGELAFSPFITGVCVVVHTYVFLHKCEKTVDVVYLCVCVGACTVTIINAWGGRVNALTQVGKRCCWF
jgi:hypothetical protein